ncbi:flavodoxin domain-containing protein [Rothia sp. ZJ1223]|uniref:flavodoxin domain-containing protein n=1 Tax=Rothia sp. ZJ1223 TaxID=2811098 RepID=UPI00195D902A|nr:flavodoxin domain-containing protein [Rothia sp. ZJ1223]
MSFSAPVLILYGSTYGHTENYARWLQEKLANAGFAHTTTLAISDVDEDALTDTSIVVVGTSDYGGFLNGASTLRKFLPQLENKKLFFFTVSFNGLVGSTREKLDEKVVKSFTPALVATAPTFHLRGGLDHTRLSTTHKTVLQGVRVALSTKLKKNLGNQQMLESFSQGKADYSDPESLNPLVQTIVEAQDASAS